MAITISPAQRQTFSEQWTTIESLSNSRGRQWMAPAGVLISEAGPSDEFFNLPVVLAFSLLDEVLGLLASQGTFATPKYPSLGQKMKDSKGSLPWVNYPAVEAAKSRRNALAHKGTLIPKAECLQIVDLIGVQLRSFGAV